jgi:hypothetical protein
MARIVAMSEEIWEALRKIQTCPAPCKDGMVSVALSSGCSRKAACPVLNRKCAYGVRLEDEFNRYLAKMMFEAGVPLRHIDKLGAPRRTTAVQIAREWGMRGFLVLTGGSGVGKSFGAACAVKRFLESKIPNRLDRGAWRSVERSGAGRSVMWCDADDIAGDGMIALRARGSSLLVVDDLGGERGASVGQCAIRGVISKRYDSKLPTVVTTGLTMLDIRNKYGRYIAERLIEDVRHGGKIVECGDVSIRLNI